MFLDTRVGELVEILSGRKWSRQETYRQISARILTYQSKGIAHGERVFIHYGNNLEFFGDLLALWHLGASVVPIDTRLTDFEVDNLARSGQPRFSLINEKTTSSTIGCLQSAGIKLIDVAAFDFKSQTDPGALPIASRTRLDDEALLLFTSGSTGLPKGVVHTHRSLRARWMALRQSLGVEAYRRTLCLLPTHFGHGLICNSLFPWLSGMDLFIAPPFSADLLMQMGRIIDEHEITFLSSVPSMWGLALKSSKPPQNHSLIRVHCGSAPLSGRLWKQIQEWAATQEVFNAYGITETGSWVAGTTLAGFTPEDGLIGMPWGSVIKVLRSSEPHAPFEPEIECPAGVPGTIWINTPALMQGYLGQPELTDRVVCGGWFLTGDIGVIDEQGRLYLKGREREEINKGGTKIYPADIEAVVERFEQTREACSFAIADPLYGQNVAIAVVLKNADAATIQSLHGWMRRHLAEFKMPIRWYIVESLPRTSRGKIDRNAIQESCIQRAPLDLPTILRSQT